MVSKKIAISQFTNTVIQHSEAFFRKLDEYECAVTFKHNNIEGNANSVLSVLSACANDGDEMLIICEGKDEKVALKKIVDALEHGNIK